MTPTTLCIAPLSLLACALPAAQTAVGSHPETWEQVIRNLRAGMMLPPGMPRPPFAEYEEDSVRLKRRRTTEPGLRLRGGAATDLDFHPVPKPENVANYSKMNRCNVRNLACFADKLSKIPDGDGTILDGNVNRYIACSDTEPTSNMLLALLNKFGIERESFGSGTKPIPL